jgi:hypothetical protein
MSFADRRKWIHRSLLAAGLFVVAACSSDDDDDGNGCGNNPTAPGCLPAGDGVIEGDITASRTLFSDTTYTLRGFVHVAQGVTLTIQPGTVIKGDFAVPGSSLFILRGARIVAQGTADDPIVFTSSQPEGSRLPGDWGGLVIVGNASANRAGDIAVEGTGTYTAGNDAGQNYLVNYITTGGNTADADNSGSLSYVRVEYAGFAPSQNNELNAFTFAAVGSGTQLSFLQALAGLDDSFEFFGGTVNGNHLVSYEAGDDHFDMSEGYRGHLQYLIGLQTTQFAQRPGVGSPSSDPQGIENDGCNGGGCTNGFNSAPFTTPVVANFTLVGTGDVASSGSAGGTGVMLRRGTGGWYVNGIVARWPRAGVSLRDAETYARAGATAVPDLATTDLAIKNVLFAQVPADVFEPQAAPSTSVPNPPVQSTLDLAANALVYDGTATVQTLFTAFPATVDNTTAASAFDWTPAAGSPAATGGLQAFTGKLQTNAGGIAGTAYVGAAQPGGPKWWQGWTSYSER